MASGNPSPLAPFCWFDVCQVQLTPLLADSAFMSAFHDESRRRLRASYEAATTLLRSHRIPFLPASAGLFLMLDLRQWLPPSQSAEGRDASSPWASERKLFDALLGAGVLMTPGRDCAMPEPGFFRCCFPWVSSAEFAVAAQRLALLRRKTCNP